MSFLSRYNTQQLFDLFCKDDIDCKPVALKEMRERWVQSDDANKDVKYHLFLLRCVVFLNDNDINGIVEYTTIKGIESWLCEKGYFTTEDEKFRISADIPDDVCSCNCHRNDCACMCCDKCYQAYIIDGKFNEDLYKK